MLCKSSFTEIGVDPLVEPNVERLERLGGRTSGRSAELLEPVSFAGVVLLSVESERSMLLVREEGFFLNIPVNLSFTVFFSFLRSNS